MIEPRGDKAHLADFARAVGAGLSSHPKSLPWPFFYDDEGSRLFEAICELPEYYLTRTEDEILRRSASEMVAALPAGREDGPEPTIVELGSGSAVKTPTTACRGTATAGPAALRADRRVSLGDRRIRPAADRAFPRVRVTGYVADYRRGLERIMTRARGPRLIVFLGSSLGNYEMEAAGELLSMIARTMRRKTVSCSEPTWRRTDRCSNPPMPTPGV